MIYIVCKNIKHGDYESLSVVEGKTTICKDMELEKDTFWGVNIINVCIKGHESRPVMSRYTLYIDDADYTIHLCPEDGEYSMIDVHFCPKCGEKIEVEILEN